MIEAIRRRMVGNYPSNRTIRAALYQSRTDVQVLLGELEREQRAVRGFTELIAAGVLRGNDTPSGRRRARAFAAKKGYPESTA